MSLFSFNGDGVVSLQGRLDHQTIRKDLWQVIDNEHRLMVKQKGKWKLDLKNVEYVDSAGLAWLINAIKQSNEQNICTVVANVPEKLMKLAKISDVDTLLPLE